MIPVRCFLCVIGRQKTQVSAMIGKNEKQQEVKL